MASDALVAAITRAAAITASARVAAVLARLPPIPLLRSQLRRLRIACEPNQVPLLSPRRCRPCGRAYSAAFGQLAFMESQYDRTRMSRPVTSNR
ncbi:MAG TPA: hypothetical protein VEA99_08030 [Gemmatimonadaceae bacterium]|nr:hypothetical protein [Gemmatimonadaceae bacterium]